MMKLLLVLLVLLAGCGIERQTENYPGVDAVGTNYKLTATNHLHGRGQPKCFSCHVVTNIHQVQRGGASGLGLSMARDLAGTGNLDYCYMCHCSGGSFDSCPQ